MNSRIALYTVLIIIGMLIGIKECYGETIQEEFNGKSYSPQLEYYYKDTSWTAVNISIFGFYLVANAADVYTSQRALDRGGVEGNPIMPESTGGMILTKVVLVGVFYYVTETWLVPKYGTNARNWIYGTGAVVLSAVSIHNNSVGD